MMILFLYKIPIFARSTSHTFKLSVQYPYYIIVVPLLLSSRLYAWFHFEFYITWYFVLYNISHNGSPCQNRCSVFEDEPPYIHLTGKQIYFLQYFKHFAQWNNIFVMVHVGFPSDPQFMILSCCKTSHSICLCVLCIFIVLTRLSFRRPCQSI